MNAAAAHVLVAVAAAAVCGLPVLAAAALLARTFGSAAARFRIYAAAFAAVAAQVPLALTVSVLRPAAAAAPAGAGALERALALHAPMLAAGAAAATSLILLGDLACDLVRLLRIKQRSVVDRTLPPQRRRARVAASARVRTPTAIGYLHPRIVVPADLRTRVDAAEFRAIVAHENAHLDRFDDWTKALQTAVLRALWFLPALWVLAARLDLERELASDERAVDGSLGARAYAACLVRLAADVRRPRAAPAAWTRRSQVAERVERLLQPARRASRFATAARSAALAAVIALSAAAAAAVLPPAPAPRAAVAVAVAAPARVSRPPRRAAVRPPAPRLTIAQRPPRLHARHAFRFVKKARRAPAAPQLLALSPGAPCRTCLLVRRPVKDGPARVAPAHRPAMAVRSPAPVAVVPDQAGGEVDASAWNSGLMRAVFIVPPGR